MNHLVSAGGRPDTGKPKSTTVAALVLKYREVMHHSTSTESRYRAAQDTLQYWAEKNGRQMVASWDVDTARAYLFDRSSRQIIPQSERPHQRPTPNGAKEGTIRFEVGHFRTLFRFAVERGYTTANPFLAIKMKRPDASARADNHNILTLDAQQKVLCEAVYFGKLCEYSWHGGLREVWNEVNRAVNFARDGCVGSRDSMRLHTESVVNKPKGKSGLERGLRYVFASRRGGHPEEFIAEVRHAYITEENSPSRAAKRATRDGIRISESTVRSLAKKHGW